MQSGHKDSSSLKPLILIVNAEANLNTFLKDFFEREHYPVASSQNGDEVIGTIRRCIRNGLRIFVILDLMPMDQTGIWIIRSIRSSPELKNIPILAVSDPAGEAVKVRSLEEGADDFMEKPFNIRELLARVNSLSRRFMDKEQIRFLLGPLVVDPQRKEAFLNGMEIPLTPREFQILHYLILHQGNLVRKAELIEALQDESDPIGDDNLKVHVHALRRKLDDRASHPRFIETIRGLGYRFKSK